MHVASFVYRARRFFRFAAGCKSCIHVPQTLRYDMYGGQDAIKSTLQVQTEHRT